MFMALPNLHRLCNIFILFLNLSIEKINPSKDHIGNRHILFKFIPQTIWSSISFILLKK